MKKFILSICCLLIVLTGCSNVQPNDVKATVFIHKVSPRSPMIDQTKMGNFHLKKARMFTLNWQNTSKDQIKNHPELFVYIPDRKIKFMKVQGDVLSRGIGVSFLYLAKSNINILIWFLMAREKNIDNLTYTTETFQLKALNKGKVRIMFVATDNVNRTKFRKMKFFIGYNHWAKPVERKSIRITDKK